MNISASSPKFGSFYQVSGTPEQIRGNSPEPVIDNGYCISEAFTYFYVPNELDRAVEEKKLKGLKFHKLATNTVLSQLGLTIGALRTREGRQQVVENVAWQLFRNHIAHITRFED
jgi:hypothetical protein